MLLLCLLFLFVGYGDSDGVDLVGTAKGGGRGGMLRMFLGTPSAPIVLLRCLLLLFASTAGRVGLGDTKDGCGSAAQDHARSTSTGECMPCICFLAVRVQSKVV
jgi:hypothetical protein